MILLAYFDEMFSIFSSFYFYFFWNSCCIVDIAVKINDNRY